MKKVTKYTIVIDRLEILLTNDIGIIEEDFVLNNNVSESYKFDNGIAIIKKEEGKNPRFHYKFTVRYNSIDWAELFYSNKGTYRFNDNVSSLLVLKNHVLYESGLSNKLQIILEALGCNFLK